MHENIAQLTENVHVTDKPAHKKAPNMLINNGIADLLDTVSQSIMANNLAMAQNIIGQILSEYNDNLDEGIRNELLNTRLILDFNAKSMQIIKKYPYASKIPTKTTARKTTQLQSQSQPQTYRFKSDNCLTVNSTAACREDLLPQKPVNHGPVRVKSCSFVHSDRIHDC